MPSPKFIVAQALPRAWSGSVTLTLKWTIWPGTGSVASLVMASITGARLVGEQQVPLQLEILPGGVAGAGLTSGRLPINYRRNDEFGNGDGVSNFDADGLSAPQRHSIESGPVHPQGFEHELLVTV